MQEPIYDELPMKWYKFLIYFALFFAAIIDLINGIKYISGNQYGSTYLNELVYIKFPTLKPIDIMMGIVMILIGIASIITRCHDTSFSYMISFLIDIFCVGAFGTIPKELLLVFPYWDVG